MGQKLVDVTIQEVALVRKGAKPVHPEATIEFFKAFPTDKPPEADSSTKEGGFFSRVKKSISGVWEKFTKGAVADEINDIRPWREINEVLGAMQDATWNIRWDWDQTRTPEQKQQALLEILEEGSGLLTESIAKIGTDIVDISKAQTEPQKGKGNEMDQTEIKKAVQDGITEAMAGAQETIKKAVEDANKPFQEAFQKSQDDLKTTVEKATTDFNGLVETARNEIAKAVDDAKVDIGRLVVEKANPAPPAAPTVTNGMSMGDAIRTLMNN